MTDKTEQPRANAQDFGVRIYECQNCGVDVVMANGESPKGWVADLFDSTRHTCESCLPRVTE
jgi:hypothetical protein